jgi:hypothetical protein
MTLGNIRELGVNAPSTRLGRHTTGFESSSTLSLIQRKAGNDGDASVCFALGNTPSQGLVPAGLIEESIREVRSKLK